MKVDARLRELVAELGQQIAMAEPKRMRFRCVEECEIRDALERAKDYQSYIHGSDLEEYQENLIWPLERALAAPLVPDAVVDLLIPDEEGE
jgi:hypothetical protein